MKNRSAKISRTTKETTIDCTLNIDGAGKFQGGTGLGFLDHMVAGLAKHSGMDIELTCKGDLHVDDHHTVEDCALVLGQTFAKALGDKAGITRFGYAYAPLDDALCRAVLDLSGRPYWVVQLQLERPSIGDVASENLVHFFGSFSAAAKINLHLDVLRGLNDHHRAESAFKAFALAIKAAVALSGGSEVPSTKGVLV